MAGKTMTLAGLMTSLIIVASALSAAAPATSDLWNDTEAAGRIIEIGKHDNRAMKHLEHLCNEIGTRPAGSEAHHETAEWAYRKFREFGLVNVHLEQCGDWPGRPDAQWAAGIIAMLTRTVLTGSDDTETVKRVPIYNVVADIPGAEVSDEYVIIGAHYDSVPIGSGAVDNGTGVAAALEAARILMESGARPRRTIRFVLFAGEEVGLLGSSGYVKAHPDLMPKISAMYNMDHGTNYISGISATAPLKEDMDHVFALATSLDPERPFEVSEVDWLLAGDPNCCQGGEMTQLAEGGAMVIKRAFKQLPDGTLEPIEPDAADLAKAGCGGSPAGSDAGVRQITVSSGCAPGCGGGQTLTMKELQEMDILTEDELAKIVRDPADGHEMKAMVMGSSDQSVFLAAGVPGFWWAQDGDSTVAYPAHTAGDTYDKVIPEYLAHSATVIALGALGTANLDGMLSREKLARPKTMQSAMTAR